MSFRRLAGRIHLFQQLAQAVLFAFEPLCIAILDSLEVVTLVTGAPGTLELKLHVDRARIVYVGHFRLIVAVRIFGALHDTNHIPIAFDVDQQFIVVLARIWLEI